MRVLLVENDPLTRGLVADILREDGHEVREVAIATEAVVALKLDRWDALVLDLVLVGQSGFTVLRQCADLLPPRVVVITGLTPEDTKQLEEFPEVRVLYKPFQGPELLALLAEPTIGS